MPHDRNKPTWFFFRLQEWKIEYTTRCIWKNATQRYNFIRKHNKNTKGRCYVSFSISRYRMKILGLLTKLLYSTLLQQQTIIYWFSNMGFSRASQLFWWFCLWCTRNIWYSRIIMLCHWCTRRLFKCSGSIAIYYRESISSQSWHYIWNIDTQGRWIIWWL